VAQYSGDDNNFNAISDCTDPNETVQVNPVTPSITTQASTTVPVGGTISDTADLEGGFSPTGTITFSVYGPNDDSGCDDTPAFTAVVDVSDGNGT
jgi:hypothetical protein